MYLITTDQHHDRFTKLCFNANFPVGAKDVTAFSLSDKKTKYNPKQISYVGRCIDATYPHGTENSMFVFCSHKFVIPQQ